MNDAPVFVEIENNRIYITSQLIDRDRCKQISGTRWDKDKRQWHVPVSWAHCKQLRSVFGDRLQIGPSLMEWAKKEVSERIQPSIELRSAMLLPWDHEIRIKLVQLGYAPYVGNPQTQNIVPPNVD